MKKWLRLLVTALLAFASAGSESFAQTPEIRVGEQTRTVVPGPGYDAGWLARKFLGDGWRDVWVIPVSVPVFDMGTFAGGLKVESRGGGNQTRSLHFVERNGWREYLFRSVDKFPVGQAMPSDIRGTPVGDVIQDQVSSLFPAGALMIPPFLEAIGILHVKPQLYVMPDDPRLGEHRREFAGLLGTVELSPQEGPNDAAGFGGSKKILNADKFLEEVGSKRENRPDERELFAVRLIDFLVNDNDRTADNIRFARYGSDGDYTWRPVPRDRDRVFVDAGGFLVKFLIRPVYPKLIEFGPDYDLKGLTFESHNLDRRLLQRLTRADVEQIADRVHRSTTDAVIERAIAELPLSWRQRTDAVTRLRTNLRSRRDQLPDIARKFYDLLATEVDVHGTDQPERATVVRLPDGRVNVSVRGLKETESATPFSDRTFIPGETNEVRIFLHGDDDVAVVRGSPRDEIVVRVIGGGGDDVLIDSAGGGSTRFYDAKGKNRFTRSDGTKVSEREWKIPEQGEGIRFDAPWRPDWGKSIGWGPALGYAEGAGIIVGFGPRYLSHGFRRLPHKLKASANLLLGTANRLPGVDLNADYRFENSPRAFTLAARGTRFEAFPFHGFGNDVRRQPREIALVDQDLIAIEPLIVHQIGWRQRESIGFGNDTASTNALRPLVGRLYGGPVFLWNRGHPQDGSPYDIAAGDDPVARAGGRLGLELDRTSSGPVSDRGWKFETELEGYPPVLDIEETFTTASAKASVYVPFAGNGSHFAFGAGGASASGAFPPQHAPSIGGKSSVRGYAWRRYAGDRSAFGRAEVRIPVGRVPLLVRWRVGAFGLAETGRVWYDGDSPGGWHTGVGGGLWFSSLGQTFSFAYAHGEEHRVYVQKGMFF